MFLCLKCNYFFKTTKHINKHNILCDRAKMQHIIKDNKDWILGYKIEKCNC